MKTIKFESNYGNFAYRMTADIGDDVNDATQKLCEQGLANICYRVAGSYVDKKLGVKSGKGEPGRRGVEYSVQDGEIINAAVSEKLGELVKKEAGLSGLGLSFAVTGQHEYGADEASPMVRATTFVEALMDDGDKEAQMRGLFGALGMEGAVDADKEALVAFAHERKLGIQPAKKGK